LRSTKQAQVVEDHQIIRSADAERATCRITAVQTSSASTRSRPRLSVIAIFERGQKGAPLACGEPIIPAAPTHLQSRCCSAWERMAIDRAIDDLTCSTEQYARTARR
jgi:hypothetical protein